MITRAIYDYFSSPLTLEQFRNVCAQSNTRDLHLMLITGRCGSSFLSHIATNVGFGKGEETFNEWPEEDLRSLATPQEFEKFLLVAMQLAAMGGRFYFQIDPLRLQRLSPLLPPGCGLFPDVASYTVLLRRDIVAQAISYFNAVTSGRWHSTQEGANPLTTMGFSPRQILYWIEHIHRTEETIVGMFPGGLPDTYYYEDLNSAPFETILRFLQRSGFSIDSRLIHEALSDEARPKKLVYDTYPDQYASVLASYPWLMDALMERSRGSIPAPTLVRMLPCTADLDRKLLGD